MMRAFALLLLSASIAPAQMQIPPGTSSSVPETSRQAAPSAESVTLQHAEDLVASAKYAEAVALLGPLATSSQKNERIFYDLGFAQDALGHDAEAVAAYRSALALDSGDAAARISLGLLLARDGDATAGEEQLATAVKIPGTQPALLSRAWRALAQMHLQNKPQQASDDLIAALKLSPETPEDALLAAQIADALHDDAAAETAYAHAQQLAPGDPEVALGYARLLSRQKKYAEAVAALEPARRAHPENRELLSEVAAQELLQGDTAKAISRLEQIHAGAPGDAAISRLLASAYVANGTPEKANPIYTGLLEADPDNAALQVEWADCLIRQKRSPEAEPVLKRALARPDGLTTFSAKASAEGMLAFAASANHDPETVLTALTARAQLAPPTAPYTFLAATAHDTLRHTKQAAEEYRLFLQQAGGSFPDQVWQAQQRLHILDRSK